MYTVYTYKCMVLAITNIKQTLPELRPSFPLLIVQAY